MGMIALSQLRGNLLQVAVTVPGFGFSQSKPGCRTVLWHSYSVRPRGASPLGVPPITASAATVPEGVTVVAPWLLVGLGNPGSKYEGTRHNIGFEMVDTLARAEGISINVMQSRALVGRGRIRGVPVLLAKPQTYMNLSGEAVGPLAAYYKIPKERVLVMYDDLDLDVGTLRLLPKGGPGGHNGMKSIIQHFKGSKDFPRLRLGIGRPAGNMAVAAYVLQKFDKRERVEMDLVLQSGGEAARMLLSEGLAKAATAWNYPRSVQGAA